MTKQIKSMSLTNKLILTALLLVAITNPWSVAYIGSGIDTAVYYFTIYANYVFIGGLILMGMLNAWLLYRSRQQVNIPKKSAKTQKAGKYIES